jgi:hypothetical protein
MARTRNPAAASAAAAVKAAKAGDDVTAAVHEFYAQSNTAVDGIHFAYGDPIIGVTDRDQINLAVRLRAIGPTPPEALPGAIVTAAAPSDPSFATADPAEKKALIEKAALLVTTAGNLVAGAKVSVDLAQKIFDAGTAAAEQAEAESEAATAAAAADGADDATKAKAAALLEAATAARERATAAFDAFEDAEEFAEDAVTFQAAITQAVAELGK